MKIVNVARRAGTAAILACAVLFPGVASAQADYPNKQIRLMVGFPPGGSTDVLSRTLAQEARKALGQEIVVINKPGASGALAVTDVANAAPDGYTIGVTPSSSMTLAHEFQNIRSDLLESTDAIVSVGRQRIGIAVKADSDIKTFQDFIERARKEPGKLSLGIPGTGTMTDVISRAVFREAGVDVTIVPFNGDAPVATAILGGHVTAGSFSAGGWNPHLAGRTMRLIASMEQERAELAPDVPTLIEMKYPLKGDAIQHLYGPKGLPPAIRQRLIAVFTDAVRSKAFIEVAKQNALYDPKLTAGEALDAYLLKDRATNKTLVQKLGLGKK